MLDAICLFSALAVIESIKRAYQIPSDAADALEWFLILAGVVQVGVISIDRDLNGLDGAMLVLKIFDVGFCLVLRDIGVAGERSASMRVFHGISIPMIGCIASRINQRLATFERAKASSW